MNPLEIDRLQREATRDVLNELCTVLGIKYIVLTEKQMQVGFDDEIYIVKNPAAYNPKTLGKCVADIMMTGKCDLNYTVKQNRRKNEILYKTTDRKTCTAILHKQTKSKRF